MENITISKADAIILQSALIVAREYVEKNNKKIKNEYDKLLNNASNDQVIYLYNMLENKLLGG